MSADTVHGSSQGTLTAVMLLVGVALGFGVSMFGVHVPWAAAAVAAVVGLVLNRSRPLLFLALGLALGGFVYIALGLFWNLVDDPSSASGGS
jgi:hypothetical protein